MHYSLSALNIYTRKCGEICKMYLDKLCRVKKAESVIAKLFVKQHHIYDGHLLCLYVEKHLLNM